VGIPFLPRPFLFLTTRMEDSAIAAVIERAKKGFNSKKTLNIEWRRGQLLALLRMLNETKTQICDALHADLRQTPFLSNVAEVDGVVKEAENALRELDNWCKPEARPVGALMKPGKGFIRREPFGVALIISPWNYPISLLLKPMIGALAAGNAVVLKPSEVSAKCSEYFVKTIPKYMDSDCVGVVEGGVKETTFLLQNRFDYIFYTGNTNVGKIVMRAAAEHLTPVTLELGGKSPCIVDETADLDVAANRICWGKFMNCGQTCVAPDYVLVTKKVEDALFKKLCSTIRTFYGEDPQQCKDYSRVINPRHTQRLAALIKGKKCDFGGKFDVDDCYIEPTLVRNVDSGDALMQDEIFGPILPILPVADLKEATEFVTAREKPLALYMFSSNEKNIQYVIENTTSGGAAINEVVMQVACQHMPFGGVGYSGMGAYNGHCTFKTFSHERSVLQRTTWPDVSLRYPPYTADKIWWFTKLNSLKAPNMKFIVLFVLAPALAAVVATGKMRGWW